MTSNQRKHLAELILAYGDACRNSAIAWSLRGDVTASAKKEADELVDYLFEIEACDDKCDA
jgi:hypothetical protein